MFGAPMVITPYVHVQYRPHVDVDDKTLESAGISKTKWQRPHAVDEESELSEVNATQGNSTQCSWV